MGHGAHGRCGSPTSVGPVEHTDAERLDQLESDVASVASAMETVDRIVAETPSGDAAATEIAAVVSPERFPLDEERLPLREDVPTESDFPG